MENKICNKCNKLKNDYRINPRSKKLDSVCNECQHKKRIENFNAKRKLFKELNNIPEDCEKCTACNTIKKQTEFYKKNTGSGRKYSTQCKVCQRTRMKDLGREHHLKVRKEWMKNPGVIERVRKFHQDYTYTKKGKMYRMWYRAKSKTPDTDLLLEDIKIPETCCYLGVKFEIKGDYAVCIDRIDNTKGYYKNNVQFISNKANRMKTDASIQELITFSKNVLKLNYEDIV